MLSNYTEDWGWTDWLTVSLLALGKLVMVVSLAWLVAASLGLVP